MSHKHSRHDTRQARETALLERLREAHPMLHQHRPLAAGIDTELAQAHPDEEAWLLTQALRLHLHSDAYLQAIAHGGPRYDLAGNPAGQVTDDERHHARATLKHRQHHRHGRVDG
jgi:ProP effector